jgi:uncharacterized protein (TIGR02599 family)
MIPHTSQRPYSRQGEERGFSLVELLAAMCILALLLAILLSVTNQTTSTVKQAMFKIDAFGTARAAQDIVTQRLSQATLNTYWDYYDTSGSRRTADNASNFSPIAYGRASDLQFVIMQNTQTTATTGQEIYFQAPVAFSSSQTYQSTRGLLNTCAYFVRYGNDQSFSPGVVTAKRWRYRLMEAIQPTEDLQIYQNAGNNSVWIPPLSGTSSTASSPVADNVVAMIVWPRLSVVQNPTGDQLTPDYTYDSKNYQGATGYQKITANQLPPMVQISFIIIDEPSAIRIDTHSSTPPPEIAAALAGKFIKSTVAAYQEDLDDVAEKLVAKHINYRILTSLVVLRESKWSK